MKIKYQTLDHLVDKGYRVGTDGSVWSRKPHQGSKLKNKWNQLKPYKNDQRGYLGICLIRNGKRVFFSAHRLVLLAFRGPCPPGMECCHFPDRNPGNNNLSNLRWATRKSNHADKRRHGTIACGEKQGLSKLTKKQVETIRKTYRKNIRGYGCKTLAKRYGVTEACIQCVVKRKTWKHI